jgi:hypothetical protein
VPGKRRHRCPRFRALALFGRRPPERVERFVIAGSRTLARRRRLDGWHPDRLPKPVPVEFPLCPAPLGQASALPAIGNIPGKVREPSDAPRVLHRYPRIGPVAAIHDALTSRKTNAGGTPQDFRWRLIGEIAGAWLRNLLDSFMQPTPKIRKLPTGDGVFRKSLDRAS